MCRNRRELERSSKRSRRTWSPEPQNGGRFGTARMLRIQRLLSFVEVDKS